MTTQEKFFVVISSDDKRYHRHKTLEAAQAEAQRLADSTRYECRNTNFIVFAPVSAFEPMPPVRPVELIDRQQDFEEAQRPNGH